MMWLMKGRKHQGGATSDDDLSFREQVALGCILGNLSAAQVAEK